MHCILIIATPSCTVSRQFVLRHLRLEVFSRPVLKLIAQKKNSSRSYCIFRTTLRHIKCVLRRAFWRYTVAACNAVFFFFFRHLPALYTFRFCTGALRQPLLCIPWGVSLVLQIYRVRRAELLITAQTEQQQDHELRAPRVRSKQVLPTFRPASRRLRTTFVSHSNF